MMKLRSTSDSFCITFSKCFFSTINQGYNAPSLNQLTTISVRQSGDVFSINNVNCLSLNPNKRRLCPIHYLIFYS